MVEVIFSWNLGVVFGSLLCILTLAVHSELSIWGAEHKFVEQQILDKNFFF